VGAGTCAPGSSGFVTDDAGQPMDCTGDGVCRADLGLDGGWYRFTGAHDQLFSADGGPGLYHCGTLEPGWLSSPYGPTPFGIPTPGLVCFEGEVPGQLLPCDWSANIQILNCGDAGTVYQLPNFPGFCSAPNDVELGAYCTQ